MTTNALPQWFAEWLTPVLDVNARQVFFVVGCQKSGTTWVQKLLSAHPQIACQGEGHLCDTAASLLQQVAVQYNSSQSASNRLDAAMLLNDDDLHGLLKVFCDRMLAAYITATGVEPRSIRAVGDKTPEHANAIVLLRRLYPSARFIHIIRDGRDAAVSGWAHLQRQGKASTFSTFADYAAYFASRHWKPYITNARAAGRPLAGAYHELRYEQLHDQPHHHAEAMFTMLGVSADAATVDQCVEAASFATLTGGRATGEEDRQSHFRKGVIGDWQQHFDDDALRRFEAAAGDLLDALGYTAAAV